MPKLRLIAWNASEAQQKAAELEQLGHTVDARELKQGKWLRELRENLPDAVIIDLGRIPSQGRYIALFIRKQKTTRQLPIVMVGGDPAKLPAIQALLPDAVFTDWKRFPKALAQALANPPILAAAPKSTFTIESDKPLASKMGIKPGIRLLIEDAPREFFKAVGDLPPKVEITENPPADLMICFIGSCEDLQERIPSLARQTPVWICWRKNTARSKSNLTQHTIREIAFAAGLVDYKICSIDSAHSGMLFSKRKTK